MPTAKKRAATHPDSALPSLAAMKLPALAAETMSAIDRAWLAMDQRDNLMIVAAVLELREVRSLKRLAQTIVERLAKHARFRQRADDSRSPAAWVPVQTLDLAYHLRFLKPEGVDSDAGLRQAIERELAVDLDHTQPLWRLSFYSSAGGKVSLLFRAHHAIADGVSLMRLLMRVMDPGAHAQPEAPEAIHTAHDGPLGPLIDRLETANQALVGAGRALREGLDHPLQALTEFGTALAGTAAVGRVLSRPDDNPERFRRALSGERHIAWSDTLALAPLRALAHRRGAKLNDLFLAALAGAFGAYLRQAGPLDAQQNLRISIPVNLRAAGDESLGNQFGLVLLDLPVGVEDASERCTQVAQRMTQLKRSVEARAVLAGLSLVGHLPVFAERSLVQRVAGKSCAVVSNLPGPAQELRLAGARLVRAIFWPPQTGRIGIGVSILSYAGGLTLAACCDSGVLPEPARLIAHFQQELEALLVETPAV